MGMQYGDPDRFYDEIKTICYGIESTFTVGVGGGDQNSPKTITLMWSTQKIYEQVFETLLQQTQQMTKLAI